MHPNIAGLTPGKRLPAAQLGKVNAESYRTASLCAAIPYACRSLPRATRPRTPWPATLKHHPGRDYGHGAPRSQGAQTPRKTREWHKLRHGASLPALSINLRRKEGLGLANPHSHLSPPPGDFEATSPCPQHSGKVKASQWGTVWKSLTTAAAPTLENHSTLRATEATICPLQ